MGFQQLGAIAPAVEPAAVERPVASVETAPLTPWSAPIPVRSTGFITPFRSLALSAERGGRIVELHPALHNGGTFATGDILVKLDDSTARASLAQAEGNLTATQARLTLTRTQLQRTRALRERGVVAQDALDQLLSQEAELVSSIESLEAARQSAEIGLRQTTIKAPFSGRVASRQAELGAVVSAGQTIADIYTSDTLEVTVALREEAAALVPGLFEEGRAQATVTARFAGRPLIWQGDVVRVDGELDQTSRSLDVTIRLADVTAQTDARLASGAPAALINSFAEVLTDGAISQDLFAVPSTAVYDNGSIVRLAAGGRLWLHPTSVVHVDGEQSFVTLAAVPGDARLIISPLDLAIDGMPVSDLNLDAAELAANRE